MKSLFKKLPIFISHKRDNGQSSSDAILIHTLLQQNKKFNPFIDVYEGYLADFPTTLEEKIKESKVFILILPKGKALDYLKDNGNWVHKEIKIALDAKSSNNDIKIIPISLDRNIKFPTKEELGDIAKIADYDIVYYDPNNEYSYKKLYKAIGYSNFNYYFNVRSLVILALIIIAAFILLSGNLKENPLDETIALHQRDLKTFKELYYPNINVNPSHKNFSFITSIDSLMMEVFKHHEKVINFNNSFDKKGFENDYSSIKIIFQNKFLQTYQLCRSLKDIEDGFKTIYVKYGSYYINNNIKPFTLPNLEVMKQSNEELVEFIKYQQKTKNRLTKYKKNQKKFLKIIEDFFQSKEFIELLESSRSRIHTTTISLIDMRTSLLESE